MHPLPDNQANQARDMYAYWLKMVKEVVRETVYVFAGKDTHPLAPDDVVALSPEQIVSYNLQAKVNPDTGTDLLIEEKQAAGRSWSDRSSRCCRFSRRARRSRFHRTTRPRRATGP